MKYSSISRRGESMRRLMGPNRTLKANVRLRTLADVSVAESSGSCGCLLDCLPRHFARSLEANALHAALSFFSLSLTFFEPLLNGFTER